MAYKKEKNLLGNRAAYNKYYGDFRGVDFSNDHTQVNEQRFAYAVNVYKDYQSGEGQAIETIPGFRHLLNKRNDQIYGIHSLITQSGKRKVLIHAGSGLYEWVGYPGSVDTFSIYNVKIDSGMPNEYDETLIDYIIELPFVPISFRVLRQNGQKIQEGLITQDNNKLTISSSELLPGEVLCVKYSTAYLEKAYLEKYNSEKGEPEEVELEMNNHKSTSFIFNNKLYILDGKNFIIYDGEAVKDVSEAAYVPTTYIGRLPSGGGKEYEQANFASPYFKNTFVADGESKEYQLSEGDIDGISAITVHGESIDTETVSVDLTTGVITFAEAPSTPESAGYPEGEATVEIEVEKARGIENITGCTISTIFDNRVFLSGNPAYPNHIFWCGINNKTGYVDPTYWGLVNFQQDGVDNAPITGMIPIANTLAVLKSDTQQDGSVFYHTRQETSKDAVPVVYPSARSSNGIGCLGACANFLDDPVYISRLGLVSARNSRAIEHRSSLIDGKLVSLDLKNAVMEEWNGYLVLLVDGKIFLADSRQRYTHPSGVKQYEWYYLEDIGCYDGQYLEYRYSEYLYEELIGKTITDNGTDYQLELANAVYNENTGDYDDLRGQTVNPSNEDGSSNLNVHSSYVGVVIDGIEQSVKVYYIIKDGKALSCDTKENYIGGTFKKANYIKVIDDNLFFGTENGDVCMFNFDKRDRKTGMIDPHWYSFNGRTIFSGCATKMDCCGIPHLTKNTVKKSTVIKTKSFRDSAAKIKVRTNKKPYNQIARINNSVFSFDSIDFENLTFNTEDKTLFAIKEKEKQWVEKQYFIYTDEFRKPFALYYISYRYTIIGRLKN